MAIRLDPLTNDTDADGLADKAELDVGLNPRSRDSDGDGIPDINDTDVLITLEGVIVLVIDPGPYWSINSCRPITPDRGRELDAPLPKHTRSGTTP